MPKLQKTLWAFWNLNQHYHRGQTVLKWNRTMLIEYGKILTQPGGNYSCAWKCWLFQTMIPVGAAQNPSLGYHLHCPKGGGEATIIFSSFSTCVFAIHLWQGCCGPLAEPVLVCTSYFFFLSWRKLELGTHRKKLERIIIIIKIFMWAYTIAATPYPGHCQGRVRCLGMMCRWSEHCARSTRHSDHLGRGQTAGVHLGLQSLRLYTNRAERKGKGMMNWLHTTLFLTY